MKKLCLLFSFAIGMLGCTQEKIIKVQADIKNSNGGKLTIYEGGTDEMIKEIETSKTAKIVKEIKGDAQGHFEGNFKGKDGFYRLFVTDDYDHYYELYLKSGDDLKMNADAKNFAGTVVFSGKGAAENNFIFKVNRHAEYINSIFLSKSFKSLSIPLDETAFNKALADLAKDLELIDHSNFDPVFAQYEKKSLKEQIKYAKEFYTKYTSIKDLSKEPLSFPFEYENYAGGKTKLSDFKGKYMYIDSWATWCAQCIALMPEFKKIEEKYKNKNIVFIGLTSGMQKEFKEWKAFVKKNRMTGIQLFEFGNTKNNDVDPFLKIMHSGSIPRFVLIDPQGKIINPDIWPSDPKLQELLDKLL